MTKNNFGALWGITPCLLAIVVDSMGFGLVYPLMTALIDNSQGGFWAQTLLLPLNTFFRFGLSLSFSHGFWRLFHGRSFRYVGKKKGSSSLYGWSMRNSPYA